jgi:hypothetical protein
LLGNSKWRNIGHGWNMMMKYDEIWWSFSLGCALLRQKISLNKKAIAKMMQNDREGGGGGTVTEKIWELFVPRASFKTNTLPFLSGTEQQRLGLPIDPRDKLSHG